MLIGYARVSTAAQDLEAQISQLQVLGVSKERIYTDHGLTGANRDRPGLKEAMAALREGDTLVVSKLDRLARSVPDAHSIIEEVTALGTTLSIGGNTYVPSDPMSKLLVNVLAMVAEFERDLIVQRTREGMDIARQKGKLRGKKPKLSDKQSQAMLDLYDQGTHTPFRKFARCTTSGALRSTEHETAFLLSCRIHKGDGLHTG